MSDATSPETVLQAVAESLAAKPGGRVFVFVDHGDGTEPAVFASGSEDDAAELLLTVGDWIDGVLEDVDDDDDD